MRFLLGHDLTGRGGDLVDDGLGRPRRGEQGGEIEVTIEAIEGGVEATVRDWGRAFDPQAIPLPDVTAPLEGRRLGGLGLYLVRKVMDHVYFAFDEKNGNVVTMIKRIQPKEGNP